MISLSKETASSGNDFAIDDITRHHPFAYDIITFAEPVYLLLGYFPDSTVLQALLLEAQEE